jgi:homocysteine S-methyltransferase
VFDVQALDAFLKRIEPVRIPIVAGLTAFESVRHAEFLANEVPGVSVPTPLLERMRRAPTPEAAAEEGLAIAREIAGEIRGEVQGIQISTQAGNAAAALSLLEVYR